MEQTKLITEHIEDIRKLFIKIVIPILILFFILFILAEKIINFYINYLSISFNKIISITPMESFKTYGLVSLLLTILIIFPFIIYSVYNYVKDIVPQNIKIKKYIIISYLLSIIGFVFGSSVFSKLILLNLFNNYSINPNWGIYSVISLVIGFGFALALVSQITLLIPFFVRNNVINIKYLKDNRRIVVFCVAIFSAIITPPDLYSMMFMMIPVYGSYELGILFSRRKK